MTQIQEKILSFGALCLVPSRQQLFDGDQPLRIGSRALGLLEVLLENAGEVVSKDKLIEAVWRGIWVDEANLRANIGALRKVLGDGRHGRRYIQNVPGRGYRFVEARRSRLPTLVMHSENDQVLPYADSGPSSAKLLKKGTLKAYKGFPPGIPATEAETIDADLLALKARISAFLVAQHPPAAQLIPYPDTSYGAHRMRRLLYRARRIFLNS